MYRMLLIAWVMVVTTASVGQAETISAACAERDLQAITFIEQHGEAGDLPAATLGTRIDAVAGAAGLPCRAGDEGTGGL